LLNKLPVPVPLFTQNEQLFTQGKFLQDCPPRQFYLISTRSSWKATCQFLFISNTATTSV